MFQKKILVINGPNLNCLGKRDSGIYGSESLADIMAFTESKLKNEEVHLTWFQSNFEGEIVEKIHWGVENKIDGIVINPGGFAHTSVVIRDALEIFSGVVTEVHLSMIEQREDFRRVRMTAGVADSLLEGHGKKAYLLGILSQII